MITKRYGSACVGVCSGKIDSLFRQNSLHKLQIRLIELSDVRARRMRLLEQPLSLDPNSGVREYFLGHVLDRHLLKHAMVATPTQTPQLRRDVEYQSADVVGITLKVCADDNSAKI